MNKVIIEKNKAIATVGGPKMNKSFADLDLRNAILMKLNGSSPEDLKETIIDAIESKEEKTLPGLGVLFEILWKNSSSDRQSEMLSTMADHL